MTLSALFLLLPKTEAQGSYDSLKLQLPKHYFKTVIVLDAYRKPEQSIPDTTDFLSKKLKSYGVNQFIFSLNTPIATFERPQYDSTQPKKNTHLLLTANYMRLQPIFDGIQTHSLVKTGIGIRLVVNSGKKGIWFIDTAPFVTRDATYANSPAEWRMANTIVYSHNKSEKFNWRIGITKSFMWGNRNYLPFIGLRFGRLNKTHLSIQIPRHISLNVPVNDKFTMSFYTKPQGGMWNFSNRDSVYYLGNASTFHFTRYEINTGFRADVRVNDFFNFYVALGFSTKNNITFYSEKENSKNKNVPYKKFFYEQDMPATGFFNLGLVFKFGKTKSYIGDKNIYDAIDLNNTVGGGDDNISNGNTQIPIAPKKATDLNLKSVQDLIDYNDF
ncbi:MAG: hypothetical protein K0S32_4187 [Bacteroidetes bacterium]|nr:hypothetical protein [Bacteroidota bacterium]